MTKPSYAELKAQSSYGPGISPETVKERELTCLSMIASGQNPDGTATSSSLFVPRWGISPENTYTLSETIATLTTATPALTSFQATPQLVQLFDFQIGGDGSPFPLSYIQSLIFNQGAPAAIPMLVTQAQGGDACLSQVANAVPSNSTYNLITSWAEGAASYGSPVFFRPFREMNLTGTGGGAYNWQIQAYAAANSITNAAASALYIQAWQNYYTLVKAIAPNVLFVFCAASSGGVDSTNIPYPGDEYVDWIAMDGYNKGATTATWSSINGSLYTYLAGLNSIRPIMISEVGSFDTEDGYAAGAKATFITNLFSYVAVSQPLVKCIVWFNGTGAGDYTIQTSTSATNAYAAAVITSPYQNVVR